MRGEAAQGLGEEVPPDPQRHSGSWQTVSSIREETVTVRSPGPQHVHRAQ